MPGRLVEGWAMARPSSGWLCATSFATEAIFLNHAVDANPDSEPVAKDPARNNNLGHPNNAKLQVTLPILATPP